MIRSAFLLQTSIPVLSEAEVRRVLPLRDAITIVEQAYRDYGMARTVLSSPPAMLGANRDGFALQKVKGAILPSAGVMGLRIIADRMLTSGEETIDYCWVADATTGRPIGLVDENRLHRLRTATTGIVAARWLGRADMRSAAILGTGRIADELPALIAEAFPGLADVRVASRRLASAERFAASHAATLAMRPCETDAALDGADLVLAISSAEAPIVLGRHIRPGMTVIGLGGGPEIGLDALDSADRFVADDLTYAYMIGSVKGWVAQGRTREAIEARLVADIGQIALGERVGRENDAHSIIGIIQGMAICDVALAHAALARAAPSRPDITL